MTFLGLNSFVDFEENLKAHRFELDNFLTSNGVKFPDAAMIEYVKKMRPTHRCRFLIFSLIVDHGCLLSKTKQYFFATSPVEACVDEIRSDQGIAQILASENLLFSHKFFEVKFLYN